MGYSISRSKLENNMAIVEAFEAVVSTQEPWIWISGDPERTQKDRLRLFEILKCCEVYPEYGYAYLPESISISMSADYKKLAIAPKGWSFKKAEAHGSLIPPEIPEDIEEEIKKATEEFTRELESKPQEPEAQEMIDREKAGFFSIFEDEPEDETSEQRLERLRRERREMEEKLRRGY